MASDIPCYNEGRENTRQCENDCLVFLYAQRRVRNRI